MNFKLTCCCRVDGELSLDLAGLGNGDMLTDCYTKRKPKFKFQFIEFEAQKQIKNLPYHVVVMRVMEQV